VKGYLTSSDKETGKKGSKITGQAGLGTDIEEAEAEIFLLTFLTILIRENLGLQEE